MTQDLERASKIVAGRLDALQSSAALPHQQRVVTERQDLEEKIAKLSAFLASATSAQLPLVEVQLMGSQLNWMRGYSTLLLQRLRLWGLA